MTTHPDDTAAQLLSRLGMAYAEVQKGAMS